MAIAVVLQAVARRMAEKCRFIGNVSFADQPSR